MNAMKICNVLLAMVLAGGLMSSWPRYRARQTDASSVGTADGDHGHRAGRKRQFQCL